MMTGCWLIFIETSGVEVVLSVIELPKQRNGVTYYLGKAGCRMYLGMQLDDTSNQAVL